MLRKAHGISEISRVITLISHLAAGASFKLVRQCHSVQYVLWISMGIPQKYPKQGLLGLGGNLTTQNILT